MVEDEGQRSWWGLMWELARARMTVFSAVTYLAGAMLGSRHQETPVLDLNQLACGYAFVFSCQLTAHFLGEYFDLAADRFNRYNTRLTGGTKVLVRELIDSRVCLMTGQSFALCAFAILFFLLPAKILPFGTLMIILAHQYSAPPFRFNHVGLGELDAALVQNVLLPLFAAKLQSASFDDSILFDSRLSILVIPAAFVKFGTFIILNLADRRPDWQGDKRTLPAILGDANSAKLYGVSIVAAYTTAGYLLFQSLISHRIHSVWSYNEYTSEVFRGLIVMSSAPAAVWLFWNLASDTRRPYRMDELLAVALIHAPMPVLGVLVDCLLWHLYSFDEFPEEKGTAHRWIPLTLSLILVLNFVKTASSGLSSDQRKLFRYRQGKCIIVGGGVGGLLLGIVLKRLGIPFIILEKRSQGGVNDGADLALWPSAVVVLKCLGIDRELWKSFSRTIDFVRMQKIEFDDGSASLLKLIRMKEVVKGTGEQFRLVHRSELMRCLISLLDANDILYDFDCTNVALDDASERIYVHAADGRIEEGRIAIGADGARSICRTLDPSLEAPLRYCGEMCYRGVIDLRTCLPQVRELFTAQAKQYDEDVMTLNYGAGLRSSWGYIDSSKERGYWFVKESEIERQGTALKRRKDVQSWPHALQLLYENTKAPQLYVHAINDCQAPSKFSYSRLCLLGDAAHLCTPNMGQGACLAIEDAFVLGTLLSRYWREPDGYVEAFYQYERQRKEHALCVAKESRIQSKIGQFKHPIMVTLRESILRYLPASFFEKKLRRVNVILMDAYVDEFLHQCEKHDA